MSNSAERASAEAAKATAQSALGQQILTPILDAAQFYEAEDIHQDYYRGTTLVVTRRGIKTQAEAYKFYRDACGRDDRVLALWGEEAAFADH